jgi:hypothetical protein
MGADTERREARWNPAAFGVATPPFIAAVSVIWGWVENAPVTSSEGMAAALPVLLFGFLTWRVASVRAVVTPTTLDLRGVVRTRQMSWHEVAGIERDAPLWLRALFWRYGGQRVRLTLTDGSSIHPLALYASMDCEKVDRVVAATRRNLQRIGKRA